MSSKAPRDWQVREVALMAQQRMLDLRQPANIDTTVSDCGEYVRFQVTPGEHADVREYTAASHIKSECVSSPAKWREVIMEITEHAHLIAHAALVQEKLARGEEITREINERSPEYPKIMSDAPKDP